jgi:hypothetical protein
MPRNITGSDELLSFTHTKILEEDQVRQQGIAAENPSPQLDHKQKLAIDIANHPRLLAGQKEQAICFLFHYAYRKDGYAIARRYIKLCLNPLYSQRGTGWRGTKARSVN